MRILTSYFEFAAEVKMILDSFRLHDMGLICSTSLAGFFIPLEVDDLIAFCQDNPSFHIVSGCTNGLVWNRYHPDGNVYNLAEGNPDPKMVLDLRIEEDEILADIFLMEPWK